MTTMVKSVIVVNKIKVTFWWIISITDKIVTSLINLQI